MYNQINMTTYSDDVINAKVNEICREFVTSLYKDIDEIVTETTKIIGFGMTLIIFGLIGTD